MAGLLSGIKKAGEEQGEMTFMDHLEELRWHIVRSVAAIMVICIVTFIAKDFVFTTIVLGPKTLDFPTYIWMCQISEYLSLGEGLCVTTIPFTVINYEMAGQFLLHIKVSFILGFIFAFPYVFWEMWRFIRPALYDDEANVTGGIVFYSSLLFMIGVGFGYYILTPFSINFLGSYNVSPEVSNTISLSSYISILSMLVLASGIIFELPMVVYLFSKIGLLTPEFMKTYRKHALIVILILSAVITPPDVTSQIIISIPLLILYEISIFISARVNRQNNESEY